MSEDKSNSSSEEETTRPNEIENINSQVEVKENVIQAFKASTLEEEEIVTEDSINKVSPENRIEAVQAKQKPIKKLVSNNFETIFEAIEEAMPKRSPLNNNAFPHPRNWVGPRFMALWSLPIIAINRSKSLVSSTNPVRPYSDSEYSVEKSETIYTAAKKGFEGNDPMRFFGARFITIWVLPMAITGTVMEFLFVSPLTGVKPFG